MVVPERAETTPGPSRPTGWSDAAALVAEAVAAVLGEDVGELAATDHLLDDVGLDSFGLLLLGAELEERLGVELPVSDEAPTVGVVTRTVIAATRHARGEGEYQAWT